MRLQNPLGALCPTLESEILLALAQEDGLTPGQLVRSKGIGGSVSGARKCLERLTSGVWSENARSGTGGSTPSTRTTFSPKW